VTKTSITIAIQLGRCVAEFLFVPIMVPNASFTGLYSVDGLQQLVCIMLLTDIVANGQCLCDGMCCSGIEEF